MEPAFDLLDIKLYVPHPTRAAIIGLQRRPQSDQLEAVFPLDSRCALSADGSIFHEDTSEGSDGDGSERDMAALSLKHANAKSFLAVAGADAPPRWDGTQQSLPEATDVPSEGFSMYDMTPSENPSVLEIGSYRVEVKQPETNEGDVNPIKASFLGVPVAALGDELHRDLMGDARGFLEDWYMRECVTQTPSAAIKQSLASCLLDLDVSEHEALVWNDSVGAHANSQQRYSHAFPEVGGREAKFDEFWNAFSALQLNEYRGPSERCSWPSSLDLRDLPVGHVERYLSAFVGLLETRGSSLADASLAYPFSALLYRGNRGNAVGVLLSPLHPLRLAWNWSVQNSGSTISDHEYGKSRPDLFLRFIDGENFPLIGPDVTSLNEWISAGLAPGPEEYFSCWSFLASKDLLDNDQARSVSVLGRKLSFGTPSGIDRGGVSSVLRDYIRVYPGAPQLRIGLSAPRNGDRFLETDEAIIDAACDLLGQDRQLTGGIRVFESKTRGGLPPSATAVLAKIQGNSRSGSSAGRVPPFSWTKIDAAAVDGTAVDVQFVEDAIVSCDSEGRQSGGENSSGTCGPSLPINRFRSWRDGSQDENIASFPISVSEGSYSGLKFFREALSYVEGTHHETSKEFRATLQIGNQILGDNANWTIAGNRHLDPATLSKKLKSLPDNLSLWEWRPAFLSRSAQKGSRVPVSSTHPYTILARPSELLMNNLAGLLAHCGMEASRERVNELVSQLGIRGIGLSSLLSMGHTQSVGAIGFALAFKLLEALAGRKRN